MLRDNGAKGIVGAGLAAGDEAQVAGIAGAGAFLNGSDLEALFSEVLGSAGMIGHGGDGSAVFQAQLTVLGMAGNQGLSIVEDIGHKVVDVSLSHIVTGQNDSAHRHGGGVGALHSGVTAGVVIAAAAAGHKAQGHDQSQHQCKKLFHHITLLVVCIAAPCG